MTATTQFEAIARLLQAALNDADEGTVPAEVVKHILTVTEAQVEAAAAGLLEGTPA